MTEKELLNKIKSSADSVEIPESLTPEHIIKHLETNPKATKKLHTLSFFSMQKIASAAAILLLCGILSVTVWKISPDLSVNDTSIPDTSVVTTEASTNKKETSTTHIIENELPKKQNAGSLYTVAKSYDEVYSHLETAFQNETRNSTAYMENSVIEEAFIEESAPLESAVADTNASSSESKFRGYSSTNLQTFGVDESDCIKTDGRYIYTVTDSKIYITDTKDHQLTKIGLISPISEAADSILEIYVDNGKLIVITSHYATSIKNTDSSSASDENLLPLTETCGIDYSINTDYQTILYIYNIKDPSNPVLEGTTTQDGYYHTSRKIGDVVYLFTNKYFSSDTAYMHNTREAIIPCINEEPIPYNSIYLPNKGTESLILSSINIQNPDKIVDKVMIIHNYVNIYVGTDSIYLYQTNYDTNEMITEIAGFSMKNGIINAINATSVKGDILDSFAINEYNQQLRILTTTYNDNDETSNNLYLLDKNMQLAGSLTDMAIGEEIYAARYLNDIAYFITYRNTYPLFAVDISDIYNPVLLGELKISGFSEYLHFWDNDKLLGIGYETSILTRDILGLKLVMFDISNPTDLKTIDTITLEDYIYSPALYSYKAVLADASANLIGFLGEYQNKDYSSAYNYLLFSWENDHFTEILKEPLFEPLHTEYLRGIYIQDMFYIADTNQIISFDRKNNYTKADSLILQ